MSDELIKICLVFWAFEILFPAVVFCNKFIFVGGMSMGIYLPNMEMPKDGTYSIVHIYSDGHVSMPFWGKGMQIVSGITAVPVPAHGDLIDRGKVNLTDFEIVMCNGDYKEGMKMLLEKIESAPTIIPASEEGE